MSQFTPLHVACYGGLRPIQVDILAFLLESQPKAASKQGCSGGTPLATLMYNYDFDGVIPVEAVRLLLETAPLTAFISKQGHCPLDQAMELNRRVPISAQVLWTILDYTPNTTLCDVWSYYPINWECRMQALSYYKDQRLDKNYVRDQHRTTTYPLHSIIQCGLVLEARYQKY
jgi:hypothetical protein